MVHPANPLLNASIANCALTPSVKSPATPGFFFKYAVLTHTKSPLLQPVIKVFYERLLINGKCKKTALVACMRKLLTILNTMVKNNEPWHDAIS